jgi:hypothetical protein
METKGQLKHPDFIGVENLIKNNTVHQLCSAMVSIPYRGKETYSVPIPFYIDAYIYEMPGDSAQKTPRGDVYTSKLLLYSLKPISVPYLLEEITFGFLNTTFSFTYNYRVYHIMTQKHLNNQYYVWEALFSP